MTRFDYILTPQTTDEYTIDSAWLKPNRTEKNVPVTRKFELCAGYLKGKRKVGFMKFVRVKWYFESYRFELCGVYCSCNKKSWNCKARLCTFVFSHNSWMATVRSSIQMVITLFQIWTQWTHENSMRWSFCLLWMNDIQCRAEITLLRPGRRGVIFVGRGVKILWGLVYQLKLKVCFNTHLKVFTNKLSKSFTRGKTNFQWRLVPERSGVTS